MKIESTEIIFGLVIGCFIISGIIIGYGIWGKLCDKECTIIIDGKEYKSKSYPKVKSAQIIKFNTNKNHTVEIPVDKEIIIKF